MINRLKGRYICFADYSLDFTHFQVAKFDEMWKAGYSIAAIARKLSCKNVEIELLASDRFLKEKIKMREGGMQGTKKLQDNKIRIAVSGVCDG